MNVLYLNDIRRELRTQFKTGNCDYRRSVNYESEAAFMGVSVHLLRRRAMYDINITVLMYMCAPART